MPVLRAVGVWLALGAAVAVLAGCGSQSARPVASEINLRAGDAAGFVASRAPGRPLEFGPIGRCDGGIASSHGLPGYLSPRLSYTYGKPPSQTRTPELNEIEGGSLGQTTAAHSTVYVFDSRTAAQHELAVLSGARSRACILRDLTSPQAPDAGTGTTVHHHERDRGAEPDTGDFQIAPIAIGAGGRTNGTRDTYELAIVPGHPRRYEEDDFRFVVGRTLVELRTLSTPQPFPTATEEHLLSVLHGRADEHAL